MVVLNAGWACVSQVVLLGTMLYALVAQPILKDIADARPFVEIDAFADDAGVSGTDHAVVVRAYRHNRHLYTSFLRDCLNDSNAAAFSFGITEQ